MAKVTDVVRLYLDPPENAVVLCVDEKSQIRALDRTQPMLPMQPGRPERHAHDYLRQRHHDPVRRAGDRHRPGHRFLPGPPPPPGISRFLKHLARAYPNQQLHLVMDNYAAPKRVEIRDWLTANPRVHVHFTPTSASWLNLMTPGPDGRLIEVWFGIIERQAFHRGTFGNVRELTTAINTFIAGWNNGAHPFVWTANQILKKANRQPHGPLDRSIGEVQEGAS